MVGKDTSGPSETDKCRQKVFGKRNSPPRSSQVAVRHLHHGLLRKGTSEAGPTANLNTNLQHLYKSDLEAFVSGEPETSYQSNGESIRYRKEEAYDDEPWENDLRYRGLKILEMPVHYALDTSVHSHDPVIFSGILQSFDPAAIEERHQHSPYGLGTNSLESGYKSDRSQVFVRPSELELDEPQTEARPTKSIHQNLGIC